MKKMLTRMLAIPLAMTMATPAAAIPLVVGPVDMYVLSPDATDGIRVVGEIGVVGLPDDVSSDGLIAATGSMISDAKSAINTWPEPSVSATTLALFMGNPDGDHETTFVLRSLHAAGEVKVRLLQISPSGEVLRDDLRSQTVDQQSAEAGPACLVICLVAGMIANIVLSQACDDFSPQLRPACRTLARSAGTVLQLLCTLSCLLPPADVSDPGVPPGGPIPPIPPLAPLIEEMQDAVDQCQDDPAMVLACTVQGGVVQEYVSALCYWATGSSYQCGDPKRY